MKKGITYLVYNRNSIEKLEQMGKKLVYPKNYVIAEPDHLTPFCYIVKKGCVVSYEYYDNGEKRLYRFHDQNALFLEANVLFDRAPSLGFKTTCKTELICLSKRDLLEAIKDDPNLAIQIMESTSEKFFTYMEQVRYEKNHDVCWRICDLFLDLAQYYGIPVIYGKKVMIRQKLSQQLISEMLGVNRVTIVRAIKKMKELGLIEQDKKYYSIVDVDKLKEYQDSLEEKYMHKMKKEA